MRGGEGEEDNGDIYEVSQPQSLTAQVRLHLRSLLVPSCLTESQRNKVRRITSKALYSCG